MVKRYGFQQGLKGSRWQIGARPTPLAIDLLDIEMKGRDSPYRTDPLGSHYACGFQRMLKNVSTMKRIDYPLTSLYIIFSARDENAYCSEIH